MLLEKRLVFFGASVTAQEPPNGYFEPVQMATRLAGGDAIRVVHGSCHFDDAGFHTAPTISREQGEVCLIEWNTTGLSRFHPIKIGLVVDHFLGQGMLPVFLILCQDRNLAGDRDSERQVKELCLAHELPLIDLRPRFPGMNLLRDTVHTTSEGGRWYAEHIVRALRSIELPDAEELGRRRQALRNAIDLQPVAFTVWPQALEINEGQMWTASFERMPGLSELLLDMTIGADSPVVELTIGELYVHRLSIWDPWCHYDRRRIVPIVDESTFKRSGAAGRISIRMLPDAPDYRVCRRPGFSYEGPRRMRVHRILCANMALSDQALIDS
jgi:hypothetical protein